MMRPLSACSDNCDKSLYFVIVQSGYLFYCWGRGPHKRLFLQGWAWMEPNVYCTVNILMYGNYFVLIIYKWNPVANQVALNDRPEWHFIFILLHSYGGILWRPRRTRVWNATGGLVPLWSIGYLWLRGGIQSDRESKRPVSQCGRITVGWLECWYACVLRYVINEFLEKHLGI